MLLEAVRLLRFSDLSIKEIAARLGFNDQFAFSKAFKRQRGVAPLDYRSHGRAARELLSGDLRVLDLVVGEEEALGSHSVRRRGAAASVSSSKNRRASTAPPRS